MSKYDEIMEKIVVTAEMKQRILSTIDASDLKTDRKIIPFYPYRKLLSFAACLAVLLMGAISIPRLLKADIMQAPVDIAEIVDVDTIEELSQSVGFDIKDLTSLPFEAVETIYTNYGDGLAQIAYIGENQALYYRKSLGTDDNSGDYNIYDSESELAMQDISVTLKGNNGLFQLAVWTDGTYAYSISLTEGIAKDSFANIIRGIN